MKNKKSLGQHWLKDRDILLKIAEIAYGQNLQTSGLGKSSKRGVLASTSSHTAAPATREDGLARERIPEDRRSEVLALEVGSGLGTLTSALFKFFTTIVSVEFDPDLASKLPAQFPGKNLTVVNTDILDFDLSQLPEPYIAVGNIPYYITAPIVRKFLTAEHKPTRLVLLIQKEVAERLAAGQGDYSILGLSAQIYAKVSLGPVVGRNLFTPPPKVDSQVVILEPYAEPLASEETMKLIKLGFSSPRKKLKNNLNLSDGLLTSMDVSESARPADLSINDWKKLAEIIHKR